MLAPRVLFGGSFDPVHGAHLALADAVQASLRPYELLWIPAKRSPFKSKGPLASEKDRVDLLEVAIQGRAQERVDRYELTAPEPSYSVLTVEHFSQLDPDRPLYWLMGADSLQGLSGWHRVEDLLRLASVLVAPRPGVSLEIPSELKSLDHLRVEQVQAPAVDLSSTQVRARLEQGTDCADLLPHRVLQRIHEKGLYGTKP